jgi:hypothetical protein
VIESVLDAIEATGGIVTKKNGGQCRARTCDLLLVRTGRTENTGLTAFGTNYYGLPQLALAFELTSSRIAINRDPSGLLVGTNLGAVHPPSQIFSKFVMENSNVRK